MVHALYGRMFGPITIKEGGSLLIERKANIRPPVIRQRPCQPTIPPVDASLLADSLGIADWRRPAVAWGSINRMAFNIDRL